MTADTAPAWPDSDAINQAMDRAGIDFCEAQPHGAYKEWRRVRAEAAIRLFASELQAREAAAWAAGAKAMRDIAYERMSSCFGANVALPLPPMPMQGGNADE